MLTGFHAGALSTLFLILFISVLALVIAVFLIHMLRSLTDWSSNNNAPIQDLACRIVAKRIQFSGNSGSLSPRTSYYVTFEFEDRSRLELWIERQKFGYMMKGETGHLTFQGTRFKEFQRLQVS